MSQKAPDTLGNLLQQLKQGWGKVAPTLRSQLVKLLATLIPALEKLDARLATKPDTKSESGTDEAEQVSSSVSAARSQADKLLKSLIQGLQNLRQRLEAAPGDTATTNQVTAPEPAAVLTPASEPAAKPPLADQVRQELSIAWKFVREQLVPVVLSFLTKVVDKIDPPLTKAYGAISDKVKATPAIVNNWEKLKASSFWQKASTATAPTWRAASEKLATIKVPDNVKPILEKRAASTTLIVALVLLILFKPTPASRLATKAPKLPTSLTPTAKTSDRLAPPERGDSPLSPDKVAISNIQIQVTDVSKKYGEALIQSVQTNFKLGRLIVQLTDAWYQLDPGQQDKLMAELLGRSQKLNFKKLLVSDASQHLIARSPMVGKEMVILKRES
ncbi:hypothetical protein [Pseudanabaena sp. PCC 6802]|uniref:hypothetical protein n=1 Tax=Pseudanabaena sp. PCC 6802 TaxID=118173 RepID=UPI000346B5FE|nr:hypothetical protein [Pseudanabaena sp. PCC 6802]